MAEKLKITIEDETLKKASEAALSVEGVSSLVNVPLGFGIRFKEREKGIATSIDENTVKFDIFINVAFGARIPQVAFAVQEAVSKAIDISANIKVNIHVQGIDF